MNKIVYSNKKRVNKIIKKINNSGNNNLYVLADFDRTLTYSLIDGEKKPSLISVIRSNPKYLGEKYYKEANRLFEFYHPIEINPNINIQDKVEKMNEWWNKHLALLVKSGLKKQHIEEVVNSGIIKLRKGVVTFLEYLSKNNIPLIILSANGLGGDSIEDYLDFNNLFTKNIEVVSNKFDFDNTGKAIGYDQKIVHVFNKGEIVFDDFFSVKDKIKNKKNIILLGDSLGDPHMADGANYDEILKIGFFNEFNEKNIEHYLEKYDVLLTNDSDGDYLNDILTKKS